jgi:hypothetical protein
VLASGSGTSPWTDAAGNAGTASNTFAISESTVVPTATIASGGSLELTAASSESVTFAGGTGSLVLDQPAGFTGHIIGFTGTAPDAAHSDTIDLVGINFSSSQFTESYNPSTGLLTVSDGVQNASFTFDNFNATLCFASDGKGGTLITDPPVSGVSGAAANAPSGGAVVADPPPGHTLTIDSGTALDINAASADGVTFVNGGGTNGSLVLQDSKAFTGVITGFGGDGTLANSDTIDIQNINFAKLTTETYVQNAAGTGGTLTLSDGTNAASLNFSGNYVSDNFKFLSDGRGGTLVVDPPVQTASIASADQFVFAPTNGPTPVQHTITDFSVNLDTIDLKAFGTGVSASSLLASATPANNGQDTLITVDSHDSILLKNVHAASLHTSDFIVHA